jgi:hypothetical protein
VYSTAALARTSPDHRVQRAPSPYRAIASSSDVNRGLVAARFHTRADGNAVPASDGDNGDREHGQLAHSEKGARAS